MTYHMKWCFVALLLVVLSSMVAAQLMLELQSEMQCISGEQEAILKCFSDEGIDLNHPEYKLTQNHNNGMIFDSLISEKPDKICDVKEKAKGALTCVVGQVMECIPASFRGLIPEAALLNKALDAICENRADLNLECVQSKSKELFKCGQEEGTKLVKEFQDSGRQMKMQDLMCMIFRVVPVCQKKVLHDCGCITTKVYTNMAYDFLHPKSCPKSNPHRVVCSRMDTAAFIDDGSGENGGNPTVWFSTFFVVSCVFVATFLFH